MYCMYSYIFIYLSMWELYSLTFLSLFSIYADAYVNVNSLYIKFLFNFFLPDVASVSIAAFTCESFLWNFIWNLYLPVDLPIWTLNIWALLLTSSSSLDTSSENLTEFIHLYMWSYLLGGHQYVFLPSLIYMSSYGGPLAKVGSSAKFGVVLFKASILKSVGGPLAKVGSFANFDVLVFKASIPQFPGGSIGQSRFVCPFWCTGIQDIFGLFPWGVHWPKMTSSWALDVTHQLHWQ